MFIDVAAPCRAPSDPAPVTLTFHQPLEKIHKLWPKKFSKSALGFPPLLVSDNPIAQSDRDQGQDKSDDFSEQEDEMCGQTAILSDCSRFCQFINLPH